MGNKVYAVKYYMDWETHGLDSIFKHKEDAEEYAKLMTEKDADVDCHYSVHEEIVYSSDDEVEVAEWWELKHLFI